MKQYVYLLLLLLSSQFAAAQSDTLFKVKKLSPTDVNFITHYYEQDGNNSAVTGGTGTEELKDYSATVIVNIPLDSVSQFSIMGNVNYYTSASTDRINTISSASGEDAQTQIYLTYSEEQPTKRTDFSLSVGGATESDYNSLGLGGSWSKRSKDENSAVSIGIQAYFDRWLLIFPDELRGTDATNIFTTDKRRSITLSGTYNQVINKRLQVSLTSDFVVQNGLLSTPFHRVYFLPDTTGGIENLPATRFKNPIGLRMHYFVNDYVVMRLYYRWYWDTFGIIGNTVNIETPIKLSDFLTLYPFYRFHTQTAAEYFQPYSMHQPDALYRTSDYDLSNFQSHKWGIGLRLTPLYGIGRFKMPFSQRLTLFKYLELRYSNYQRSDGLRASMIVADFGFSIK